MSKRHPRDREESALQEFKRFFLRGLAVLAPPLLTAVVLIWAYELIDQRLGRHITHGMVMLFARGGPPSFINEEKALELALEYGRPVDVWDDRGRRLTVEYQAATHPILSEAHTDTQWIKDREVAERSRNVALWSVAFARYKLNLIGFVLAIIVVYFVGLFLASLIGRTTWRAVERLLYRTPIVRAVYPNVKQVTDFLFSERQLQFSGVVAVQYPRLGVWSLGLVTGSPLRTLQSSSNDELVTVFVPSSPTPVTGYVITVARCDMIELALTMDEAMRYAISAGVIKPQRESLEGRPADLPERREASPTSGPNE